MIQAHSCLMAQMYALRRQISSSSGLVTRENKFNAGLELESVKFSNGIEMKSFSFYATFVKTLLGMDTAEISYRIYDETTIFRPEMTQEEMMIAAKTRLKKYPITDLNNLNISFKIERNRFFLDLIISNRDETFFIRTGERENFNNAILGLIHLPALRGNPERDYKKTSVGPRFPGTFEIYAASIIHHWQAIQDPRLHSLSAALEILGLTWKVGARQLDDVSVELMVGRLVHRKKR